MAVSLRRRPTSIITPVGTGLGAAIARPRRIAQQNRNNTAEAQAQSQARARADQAHQQQSLVKTRAPTAPGGTPSTDVAAPRGSLLPPGVAAAPPPPTYQGESNRIDARQQYDAAMADANRTVYLAALAYGDPTTLAQFKDYGPVVDNPNSALSQIGRGEQEGIQNVSDAALRNNTWNGSLRLGDQQKVRDNASRQRLEARNAYDQAYYQWTMGIGTLWDNYQRAMREADYYDTSQALNAPPQPTGVTPPPTVAQTQKKQAATAQKKANKQAAEDERKARALARKKKR